MKWIEEHQLATQIPLIFDYKVSDETLRKRALQYYETSRLRRSVRSFSKRSVPREVIESCLRTAGTAPSGANQQPWHFVAVGDRKLKREIRRAAEHEEREFYQRRAPQAWLEALEPLGTDAQKPFLEVAPWLIAIFAETYGIDAARPASNAPTNRHPQAQLQEITPSAIKGSPIGTPAKHYYVSESVGIATGMLISALHHSGLATLTHTPSPMGFLHRLLRRPQNERAFLLLVVGFPARDCTVPDIRRKSLDEIATILDVGPEEVE